MSERNGSRGAGLSMGGFYRICRMLHAYLSAAAFLILLLFAVTGVLLNHPEWDWTAAADETTAVVQLTPAEVAAARSAPESGEALARAVAAKRPTLGSFVSGDLYDGQALIRLAGPKGASEVAVDLGSGRAEVKETRSALLTLLGELHRGQNSGAVWRTIIDVSGVMIALMSIIGYVLFFSLRFRLKTALALTAASLIGIVGVVVWAIP